MKTEKEDREGFEKHPNHYRSWYHDEPSDAQIERELAEEMRKRRERIFISSVTHLREIDWPEWVATEHALRKLAMEEARELRVLERRCLIEAKIDSRCGPR